MLTAAFGGGQGPGRADGEASHARLTAGGVGRLVLVFEDLYVTVPFAPAASEEDRACQRIWGKPPPPSAELDAEAGPIGSGTPAAASHGGEEGRGVAPSPWGPSSPPPVPTPARSPSAQVLDCWASCVGL